MLMHHPGASMSREKASRLSHLQFRKLHGAPVPHVAIQLRRGGDTPTSYRPEKTPTVTIS